MKKKLLIAIMLLSLIFTGCGNPAPSKKSILSDGIKNLSQKTVGDYNNYISAEITKEELISNIENYKEQADDICDNKNKDSEAVGYMSELLQMLNNEFADRENYDLPISDLKTLLSGDTVKKFDSDCYELNRIYFWIPKKYELRSKTDELQTFAYKGNIIQVNASEKFIDVLDEKSFIDFIGGLNEEGFNLLTDVSVYFSRKCNFYYKTQGTCQSDGENYNVKLYACTDSDKMITFIFYSKEDFDDNIIEQILNEAIL